MQTNSPRAMCAHICAGTQTQTVWNFTLGDQFTGDVQPSNETSRSGFFFFKDRMIDRQKKMMRYNIWSASENPWAAFTPSSSTLATAAWSHSFQYNLATFGDMSVSNHWRQNVGCVQRCHTTDTYANDSQWKWSQWSSRQSVLQAPDFISHPM